MALEVDPAVVAAWLDENFVIDSGQQHSYFTPKDVVRDMMQRLDYFQQRLCRQTPSRIIDHCIRDIIRVKLTHPPQHEIDTEMK